MIYNYLLSIFIFILYLEINSKLGGIWLRYNSKNQLIFSPIGIYNMVVYPLKNLQLWFPQNWDINFFMFTGLLTIFIQLLVEKFKKSQNESIL